MVETRREAEDLLANLNEAEFRATRYCSVDPVLNRYIETLRLRSKKASVRFSESHSDRLREHFGRDFPTQALTVKDIDEFAKQRLASVELTTVNASLRVLRAALGNAVEYGLLEALPCRILLCFLFC